jgi:hypothetical protein
MLLDNAGASCPEQPHDKGSILYEYPTNCCKINLERSINPNQITRKSLTYSEVNNFKDKNQ